MLQVNTKIQLQDHFAVRESAGHQESPMIYSRMQKRASSYPSSLDECTRNLQKNKSNRERREAFVTKGR